MGAINLDNTGSGGAITLSSDGTNLLLGGSAVGGGSPDLYADNYHGSTTKPVASGEDAVAIGRQMTASGSRAFAAGGYNNTASGTNAIAMGYATTASGDQSIAMGNGSQATISNSASIGYLSLAQGSQSVALGNSRTGGTASFAAVINNNSSSYGASGGNSVAIGPNAKCTQNGVAIGNMAQSTTNYAYSIGFGSIASGNYSFSAGRDTTASARATVALGEASLANIQGKMSFASSKFAANGDAQGGQFILRSDTTNATAEAMTTSNSTASATNQIVAASDTCITFSGTIVAMQNGAQAYGGWKVEGILVNDGGTTTLPASTVTAMDNDSSWGLALSADNTNNALKVQVTGEASHNIRWVANIQTSEVTYA